MARQHPGETQGSFMIQGIIDYLIGSSQVAKYLRQNFIFDIFPMVNPDGVYYGNYRTSLIGKDLNRIWKNPLKELHPSVYYIKNTIQSIQRERNVNLIIDLHGHSKKLNAFFYGCKPEKQPLLSRVFPFVMSSIDQRISMKESTFGQQKYKSNCGRIVMFNMLNIPNIYTLEASFYGYKNKYNQVQEYQIQDFYEIGENLCNSLFKIHEQNMLEYTIQNNEKNRNPITSEELAMKIQDLKLYEFKQFLAIQQLQQDMIQDDKIGQEQLLQNIYDNNNKEKIQQLIDLKFQNNDNLNFDNIINSFRSDLTQDKQADDSVGSDSAPSDDELKVEQLEKIFVDKKKYSILKQYKVIDQKNTIHQMKFTKIEKKSLSKNKKTQNNKETQTALDEYLLNDISYYLKNCPLIQQELSHKQNKIKYQPAALIVQSMMVEEKFSLQQIDQKIKIKRSITKPNLKLDKQCQTYYSNLQFINNIQFNQISKHESKETIFKNEINENVIHNFNQSYIATHKYPPHQLSEKNLPIINHTRRSQSLMQENHINESFIPKTDSKDVVLQQHQDLMINIQKQLYNQRQIIQEQKDQPKIVLNNPLFTQNNSYKLIINQFQQKNNNRTIQSPLLPKVNKSQPNSQIKILDYTKFRFRTPYNQRLTQPFV